MVPNRRRCNFPGCTQSVELHDVPRALRLRALKNNVYIPNRARVCARHNAQYMWNNVQGNGRKDKFTEKQINEMIHLLCNSILRNVYDSPGIYHIFINFIFYCNDIITLFSIFTVGPHNEETMKTYIGLNAQQFQQILNLVEPSLFPIFKVKSRTALYIYLMRLRTGHTYNQIKPHFNKSTWTLGAWIKVVRNIMHTNFVPLHLYRQQREDLLNNTTSLSRKLYGVHENTVVATWDATYVYTIKSSNYAFQKQSYSVQMGRNLVKFMLCVITNGYIAATYGPFEATKNDASILAEIMNEEQSIFSKFLPGDVMVVDRGFRDCIGEFNRRGFITKIPKGTRNNQLNRKDANESRLATKTRYVVEVRNAHIKNTWKHLHGTSIHQSVPHLKRDFQICAALVNMCCKRIVSDRNDWENIGNMMIDNFNQPNALNTIVHRLPCNEFQTVVNLTLFPKFTYEQLKIISQGTYQIRQAVSYVQLHMKNNNNSFPMKIWKGKTCQTLCGSLLKNKADPLLLIVDLRSRFQSNRSHKVYVLLSLECNGNYLVNAFCCSCKHGIRTIGCCSHVMATIWFTLHIDHTMIRLPSSNLDNIFGNWQNDYSDIELELNSDNSFSSDNN